MNNQEMKQLLETKEYDFLRTNENLGSNVILLVPGGSHSYGTSKPESDFDLRGISFNNTRHLLGLSKFEQYEDDETDSVIYGTTKAVRQLMECNPNTIEILGVRDQDILHITEAGKLLRDNINLFLSCLAIKTFSGYGIRQLRRLKNAMARDQYTLEEKEKHILESLELQLCHFETHYADMKPGYIKLKIGPGVTEGYKEEILMDMHLENYPLRAFVGMYSEMSNVIRDYDKINHRNKKKDIIHLNKHKMSLLRVIKKGIQVLTEQKVETYCGDFIPTLMRIRNGEMSDEEFFGMVEVAEKEFEYAAKHTTLPLKPDFRKVEDLLIEMHTIMLKGAGF